MLLFPFTSRAEQEYQIVQQPYLIAYHPVEIEDVAEYKTSNHTIIKQYKSAEGNNCVRYAKTKAELPQGLTSLGQKIGHIKTKEPKEGSIGVTAEGRYGHLVYVEKVESDGLVISEGNYRHGWITYRKISKSLVIGYM